MTNIVLIIVLIVWVNACHGGRRLKALRLSIIHAVVDVCCASLVTMLPFGACLFDYCRALSLFAKTRRAPSRHCRDARVYGHMTTAMHDVSTPPSPAPPLPLSRQSMPICRCRCVLYCAGKHLQPVLREADRGARDGAGAREPAENRGPGGEPAGPGGDLRRHGQRHDQHSLHRPQKGEILAAPRLLFFSR